MNIKCIVMVCSSIEMSCTGLLLPILGALPDALIIVVSGLGGTKEQAAEQVCNALAARPNSLLVIAVMTTIFMLNSLLFSLQGSVLGSKHPSLAVAGFHQAVSTKAVKGGNRAKLACSLQVNVGIGTLAGSTIMLLTVAWGGSLLAGRCDFNDQVGWASVEALRRVLILMD